MSGRLTEVRMTSPDLHVVFRAAAGPGIGFGHVVRCRSLAKALGIRASVWVRGSPQARTAAARVGVEVLNAWPGQPGSVPSAIVLDDPSVTHATRFLGRVRALDVPVVSIHDLGEACVPSDLAVDGSLRSLAPHGRRVLSGPQFAILDPSILEWRQRRTQLTEPDRVLIALGGGSHVLRLGERLADAILARNPHARVRIACGFSAARPSRPTGGAVWITSYDGLGEELTRAAVAVVAGGVTPLEACAIGVPIVTVPVTALQAVTTRRLARCGAAIDVGLAHAGQRRWMQAARHVSRLLRDQAGCRRQAAAARHLVDGRGVFRVAASLRQLVLEHKEGRRAA